MDSDKLTLALQKRGWTEADIEKLCEGVFLAQVRMVIRGQAEITVVDNKAKPEMQVAETLDPIIRVDRSIQPAYPNWMKKVMHPELENTGPAEFNIAQVEQWLHSKQASGVVKGKVIYKHLKDNNILKTCLGLTDLLAIQNKGIAFFRKYFTGGVVFGWKSVVLGHAGLLYVPSLIGGEGRVIVDWDWLGHDWRSHDPALRLAS